jgi:putative tryptophan/tyrosine transport system substrate-binding protein
VIAVHDDDLVADDEIHVTTPFGVDFDERRRNLDDAHTGWHHSADPDREVYVACARHVAVGLVASLARPDGNVTGQSSGGAEVAGKSVELIRELIPAARRVGVLADESDPFAKPYVAQIGQAARSAGMEVEPIITRPGQPLEAAFETLTGKRVDGLLIQGSIAHKEMLDLAIKHRLPALTSIRLGPPLEALMSYGSDYFALARQSAVYVDKILKGAKPADLPVAFPTKFLLIINLKTAKALGLEVPPTLLARADEVIE